MTSSLSLNHRRDIYKWLTQLPETWINDVAWDAFVELRDDYLQQFADRGEKSGHGSLRLKEHFAENSRYLFNKADQRVEALCNGVRTSQTRPATKTGCELTFYAPLVLLMPPF